MLFELITAEDNEFFRMVLLKHDFDKLLAEGTGTASDEHYTFLPIHSL